MHTLEKSTSTTKLPIELAITFMILLLKMNYVFLTQNSKNAGANYGFSRTIMALMSNKAIHAHRNGKIVVLIQKHTIALSVLILTIAKPFA